MTSKFLHASILVPSRGEGEKASALDLIAPEISEESASFRKESYFGLLGLKKF